MRAFLKSDQGNVALIFAIAAFPVLAAVGSAIDYTRAVNARTAMQSALDNAALMLSKDAPSLSAAEVTKRGQEIFAALLKRPDLAGVTVSSTYTPNTGKGSKLDMVATGKIATDFMKIAGYPSLNLDVNSMVAWGNTRIQVALALDVTGSMASKGKMPAMQAAAKKLIDQLSANAKKPGDLYISMIPFSTHINAGPANYTQPWLDWSYWEEQNGSCSTAGSKTRSDCVSKGKTWTAANRSTWNGCITDRDEDYDVKKTPPVTSNLQTLFQPDQFDKCPVELVPLTYDWAKLKASIDLLTPGGATNQPVGMAWGWLSLQATAPLNAPTEDPNYYNKKILIVLSDGLNTKNKKSGNGSSHDTYVDGRQKLLCDNIKADGMMVYALQVNTDGDPTSTILQYCASGPENFFMVTSPTQIMSVFDTISASLMKLRIAR